MPISRMQQPRQMYGLGSFVKKAVKGVTGAVKDVVKSDLGKAALLAAGAYYMPTYGIKAQGGLAPFFQGAKASLGNFFLGAADPVGTGRLGFNTSTLGKFLGTNAGKATAGILGASALGGMFTAKEQEDIESLRKSGDQGLLKAYLERYYKNLNPDADDETVASFVRANAAYGGRMGFADGMPEENITPMKKPDNDVQYVRDTINL